MVLCSDKENFYVLVNNQTRNNVTWSHFPFMGSSINHVKFWGLAKIFLRRWSAICRKKKRSTWIMYAPLLIHKASQVSFCKSSRINKLCMYSMHPLNSLHFPLLNNIYFNSKREICARSFTSFLHRHIYETKRKKTMISACSHRAFGGATTHQRALVL